MSDERSQQGQQGQREQKKEQGQTPTPLEKPLVERMKPYLQGLTQEPPIMDPANPNLRQP